MKGFLMNNQLKKRKKWNTNLTVPGVTWSQEEFLIRRKRPGLSLRISYRASSCSAKRHPMSLRYSATALAFFHSVWAWFSNDNWQTLSNLTLLFYCASARYTLYCRVMVNRGLYCKSFTIMMTVRSYGQYYKTISYNRKVCSALDRVINCDHKHDATIWSINLTTLESSFTIICL